MSAQPRVAIVILTHEQREMTLECLDFVLRMDGPDFDVLVWDNGSTDATVEAIHVAEGDQVTAKQLLVTFATT